MPNRSPRSVKRVGVDLDDEEFSARACRDLREFGRDHAARSAPRRPVVDDDRNGRVRDRAGRSPPWCRLRAGSSSRTARSCTSRSGPHRRGDRRRRGSSGRTSCRTSRHRDRRASRCAMAQSSTPVGCWWARDALSQRDDAQRVRVRTVVLEQRVVVLVGQEMTRRARERARPADRELGSGVPSSARTPSLLPFGQRQRDRHVARGRTAAVRCVDGRVDRDPRPLWTS